MVPGDCDLQRLPDRLHVPVGGGLRRTAQHAAKSTGAVVIVVVLRDLIDDNRTRRRGVQARSVRGKTVLQGGVGLRYKYEEHDGEQCQPPLPRRRTVNPARVRLPLCFHLTP